MTNVAKIEARNARMQSAFGEFFQALGRGISAGAQAHAERQAAAEAEVKAKKAAKLAKKAERQVEEAKKASKLAEKAARKAGIAPQPNTEPINLEEPPAWFKELLAKELAAALVARGLSEVVVDNPVVKPKGKAAKAAAAEMVPPAVDAAPVDAATGLAAAVANAGK